MPLAPRTRAIVGRGPELARLRRSCGLAGTAPTAGVLVSGDAGIGKSRLVAEVAAEAAASGSSVVAGHCVGAGGAGLAWLPFVELVRELEELVPEAVRETVSAHPALRALQPRDPAVPSPADPAGVGEAVHALLTTAARERPLLAVVEDVHWADDSSRDLLTLLLTRGFSTPVTLVVTYRSDDLHRRHPLHDVLTVWTRLPLVSRVDLGPLPGAQMQQLVRTIEAAPTTSEEVQRVVRRAEGNPFFAEEIVASGDTARTTDDLSRLLRRRLDRLGEPARELVRATSLAGGAVSADLLGEVVGFDTDTLDDALRESIDHHILRAVGDETFRFRHALLGETIAEDLLPGARRRVHTAWLTALRAHPELGSAAALARHAAATGDTETAAQSAIAAAAEAMRMGGARDALRLYEDALGWIHADPGRRAEVTLAASVAAKAAGDQVRSLDLLEEGLAELPGEGHPRLRAALLVRAAGWYATLDLPGDPLRMSQEAVALLPEWREPEDFDVLMRHLDVLVKLGTPREGADLVDAVLRRAEELDLPEVVAETRLHEGRLLSRVDPDRARPGLLATARDPHAPATLRLPALLRLGNLELGAGNLELAHEHYLMGVEVAEQRHRPWGPYGLECRLQAGRSAYELGHWELAERLLDSPDDLPHPPRGFMEGALVELLVARGEDVPPERLAETRRWWEVDVLLVVACLGGLLDLLGRADRPTELLDTMQRGVDTMDRLWPDDAQAIVRLSALFTGQVADLATRGHDVRTLRTRADDYAGRVHTLVSRADLRIGPESRAWARRLEAERLRLAAVAGERPDADDLVGAWREVTAAFAALHNAPEHARSAARLAEALHLVGRAAEARDPAETARAIARRLGARPVLDLLDGLVGPGARGTPGTPGALTPRELEVLGHLERGRTNGQIAAALFISRKTASVHVSNILAKLGATTRGEAVAIARRHGILD